MLNTLTDCWSSENSLHGWDFLSMSNSSFCQFYWHKRTMIRLELRGHRVFSVNTRVPVVHPCGTQWSGEVQAAPVVLVWSPLGVFLRVSAGALCEAVLYPRPLLWTWLWWRPPDGCVTAPAVFNAMGNLARDLILTLASCLMRFCKAANFMGCRSGSRNATVIGVSLRTKLFCKPLRNLQSHPTNLDLMRKCLDPCVVSWYLSSHQSRFLHKRSFWNEYSINSFSRSI